MTFLDGWANSMSTVTTASAEIEYPSSDGQPMAENTQQWRCMVTIKEGLDDLFADRPDVFVAGDNLWYPVEGRPDIRQAPDAYVVFGRPKGDRGSYMQWVEDDIPLHVVFEVLSPGNRRGAMTKKRAFYERYGVEEYYIYDPDRNAWKGFVRRDDELMEIDDLRNWTSPRLGIGFEIDATQMRVIAPDGQRLLSYAEQAAARRKEAANARRERTRAEAERTRAEAEWTRANSEANRAGAEKARADALAAQLRSLGIEPEA